MGTQDYECEIMDLISDVKWNSRYNMFAISGFGQHFPVLIYVYQRSQPELDVIFYAGNGIMPNSDRAADFKQKE